MAKQRWHEHPTLSPLILLIPGVSVLIGIWMALSVTTGPQEVIDAFGGSNNLLAPMVTRFVIPIVIGLIITAAIVIAHRRGTRSQRSLRKRFLHSAGWTPRRSDNPNSPKGIRSRLHFLLPNSPSACISARTSHVVPRSRMQSGTRAVHFAYGAQIATSVKRQIHPRRR